jgi:hypothetical protein
MLIKPKPGARIGLEDPLCYVKDTECLTDKSGHEEYKTTAGKWFESRREHILYNHCDNLDSRIPQMDDDQGRVREIPEDHRDGKGGPVWTKK